MHLYRSFSTFLVASVVVRAAPQSNPPKSLHSRQNINSACTTVNRGSHWHGWSSIHKIFSFGDSYTTNAFQVTGAQPSSNYAFGNPPYVVNGTSADGPNWIEDLATVYNQSYIKLYDLGVGGAAVDKLLTPELYDFIPDFTEQVGDTFLPYYGNPGNQSATWSPEHALFATFFGINDLIVSTPSGNDILQRTIFDTYFATMQQLYTAGARNFLIMNVPPIDLTPLAQGANSVIVSNFTANVALWNNRLTSMAYNLTLSYRDTTVFIFDTNRVFRKVLANPSSYLATSELKNTTGYCDAYGGGTPTQTYYNSTCQYAVNEYFWLNSLHPTWPIHNAVAAEVSYMLTDNAYGRIFI